MAEEKLQKYLSVFMETLDDLDFNDRSRDVNIDFLCLQRQLIHRALDDVILEALEIQDSQRATGDSKPKAKKRMEEIMTQCRTNDQFGRTLVFTRDRDAALNKKKPADLMLRSPEIQDASILNPQVGVETATICGRATVTRLMEKLKERRALAEQAQKEELATSTLAPDVN